MIYTYAYRHTHVSVYIFPFQGKQVIEEIQNVIGVIEGVEEPDRFVFRIKNVEFDIFLHEKFELFFFPLFKQLARVV